MDNPNATWLRANDGAWHHIAIVKADDGNITVYLDGVKR